MAANLKGQVSFTPAIGFYRLIPCTDIQLGGALVLAPKELLGAGAGLKTTAGPNTLCALSLEAYGLATPPAEPATTNLRTIG